MYIQIYTSILMHIHIDIDISIYKYIYPSRALHVPFLISLHRRLFHTTLIIFVPPPRGAPPYRRYLYIMFWGGGRVSWSKHGSHNRSRDQWDPTLHWNNEQHLAPIASHGLTFALSRQLPWQFIASPKMATDIHGITVGRSPTCRRHILWTERVVKRTN